LLLSSSGGGGGIENLSDDDEDGRHNAGLPSTNAQNFQRPPGLNFKLVTYAKQNSRGGQEKPRFIVKRGGQVIQGV
jgi:hypothetical protein